MLETNLVTQSRKSDGYFIEELTNAHFTTYADVISKSGVAAGVTHNEGSGWLRFIMDGVELIVAKKSIRHTISWNHINSADCVYGNKTITINGKLYKVRLLTGADTDPTPVTSGTFYAEGTHNSEWSRLFYPIVKDDGRLPSINPLAPYTQEELNITSGNGRFNWCQETSALDATRRVFRGDTASSRFNTGASSLSNTTFGWRACLELITE